MKDIFATKYLGIDPKLFEDYGVFDPLLTKDSSFFINVIRLKNAKTNEFSNSYDRINNCFIEISTLLEHAKEKQTKDKFFSAAIKRFGIFREINGINLGFSESKRGAGFGPKISKQELYICYLIKIEIPVKDIAKIIGRSTSAITASRIRLYKKIHKTDGTADMMDKLIIDL